MSNIKKVKEIFSKIMNSIPLTSVQKERIELFRDKYLEEVKDHQKLIKDHEKLNAKYSDLAVEYESLKKKNSELIDYCNKLSIGHISKGNEKAKRRAKSYSVQ